MKLLRTINLEDGLPTREEALLRLSHEMYVTKKSGFALLKIIHGWGSSGKGGVLRFAVWSALRQAKERGEIRAFIQGDDFRVSDETTWELLKRVPEMKNDADLGRGNKGVTIVWM